jgi:hypothetical protein
MTTEPFDIGAVARLTVNIQVDGADADPDALSFVILQPDGTRTTYTNAGSPQEITGNPSTGDYYVDHVVAQSGRHFWEFVGTGDARGATQGEFWGRRRNVGAS